jgi:hypothetical protein
MGALAARGSPGWPHLVVGAGALVLGGAIGFAWRGLLPPFEVDDSFWRAFLTGPPVAGLFAVIGALIALAGASIAAGIARRGARRSEWSVPNGSPASRVSERTTAAPGRVATDVVTDSQRASAARIRMAYDRKRGRVTEEWIRELAESA